MMIQWWFMDGRKFGGLLLLRDKFTLQGDNNWGQHTAITSRRIFSAQTPYNEMLIAIDLGQFYRARNSSALQFNSLKRAITEYFG